jgi:hypothetical protein
MPDIRFPLVTLAIPALLASALLAQSAEPGVERTFYFAHAGAPQEFQEAATVIRSIANIRHLSVEAGTKLLAVRATDNQVALAEWLFHQLDQPASQGRPAQEYQPLDGSNDLVRVFYLEYAPSPQHLQEMATVVRVTADVPRLLLYHATKAMVVRGTRAQVTLAAWLVKELDQAASPAAGAKEYRASPGEDDVVRIFYAGFTKTPQELQEAATLLRSIADVRRLVVYQGTKSITARGTAAQMALLAWLLNQLGSPQGRTAGAIEHEVADGSGEMVRIFHLHTGTPQEVQEFATTVRRMADVPRLFVYNASRALAVRGKVYQIAIAQRLMDERDRTQTP